MVVAQAGNVGAAHGSASLTPSLHKTQQPPRFLSLSLSLSLSLCLILVRIAVRSTALTTPLAGGRLGCALVQWAGFLKQPSARFGKDEKPGR